MMQRPLRAGIFRSAKVRDFRALAFTTHLSALAAIGDGARLIRPVIVAICLIILARYAWQRGLLVF